MQAEGHAAGAELIEAGEERADAETSGLLQIAAGVAVLRVRVKRFSDGLPVASSTSFLPLPRFAGIAAAFRDTGAVTPALGRCGVSDYRRLRTRVVARAASGAEAAELYLGSERILLMTQSVNVDTQGAPIQATEAVFAASRIELVIDSDP